MLLSKLFRAIRLRQRAFWGIVICSLALTVGTVKWNSILTVAASADQSVLTQHNDNQRTGAYLAERELTPTNVTPATFGSLYSLSVDGTIGAQPLYVAGVRIDGKLRDVLYVATRNNWMYAFDVGEPLLTPAQRQLWKVQLKDSRGFGAAELPGMDGRYSGDTRGPCLQTHGPVGIASTPVIDPNANTIYIVYRAASPFDATQYGTTPKYDARHYLRKMDMSGHLLGEQWIQPPQPGFDPNKVLTRTGLLLLDGVIYMGFGGAVCDTGGGDPKTSPPHGWVTAFDASTLKMLGSLNTTPNSAMGGVWQSGYGLAGDRNGFVYALTGNNETPKENTLDISTELSNAVLQLHLDRSGALSVRQHFTAHNWFRLDTGERFPGDPLAVLGL